MGFLVVASYLSRYGVSSFDVLQLQYLIAGIWLLGPPAVVDALLQIRFRFEERAAPEQPGKYNWRRLIIGLLFSSVPFVIFMLFLGLIAIASISLTWGTGIRLFLFYVVISNLAGMMWKARRVATAEESWWLNKSHAAPLYASALFVLVLGYAVWFSVRIYPLIPFSLGGGKPLDVAFFEGEKKMPEEIQKPNLFSKRSVPYKLLLATDKYFVVVSPSDKERSLEISRDSVAGIVVLSAN